MHKGALDLPTTSDVYIDINGSPSDTESSPDTEAVIKWWHDTEVINSSLIGLVSGALGAFSIYVAASPKEFHCRGESERVDQYATNRQ